MGNSGIGKITLKIPLTTAMLIGEYKHTIDSKNRISLPSRFRKEVGKKVIITHGLDNCLFLYTTGEWQKISQKLGALGFGQASTRGFNRFFLSGATEVLVDKIGRILIPEYLRSFANIKNKVVFAGVHNRVEIWDDSAWTQYKKKVLKDADKVAESLGNIGAI